MGANQNGCVSQFYMISQIFLSGNLFFSNFDSHFCVKQNLKFYQKD